MKLTEENADYMDCSPPVRRPHSPEIEAFRRDLAARVATDRPSREVSTGTTRRPAGECYVHKEYKDGNVEHCKVVATGKPAFAGAGKKIRHVTQFADGTAQAKGEGGHVTKHASVDEAKAYLDRP